jgi:hypothetical protein
LDARIYENSFHKTFVVLAVSAGVVLLLGMAMFFVRGLGASKFSNNSTPVALAVAPSSSTAPAMLEVHIANNGMIFVHGAKVTAISGDTIQTTMSWNSTNFNWVVQTTGMTKFFNRLGQKQYISDIKEGDVITVTGKLASQVNQFTINADFVRE